MPLSLLAERLNWIKIDRNQTYSDYRSHPSNPTNMLPEQVLKEFFNKLNLSSVLNQKMNDILFEYWLSQLHTLIFAFLLYFTIASVSYFTFFVFQKERFLPEFNQKTLILHDIKWSCYNMFWESFLVAVLRLWMPRYSLVYYNFQDYSLWIIPFSIIFHMIYDETLTYWFHRWLHTYPSLYTMVILFIITI